MSSDRGQMVFRRVFQALAGTLVMLMFAFVAAGGYVWYMLEVSDDGVLDVSLLRKERPAVTSYVYAADGSVIGEFAELHRSEVPYEEIPRELRLAIMAAEDDFGLTS